MEWIEMEKYAVRNLQNGSRPRFVKRIDQTGLKLLAAIMLIDKMIVVLDLQNKPALRVRMRHIMYSGTHG